MFDFDLITGIMVAMSIILFIRYAMPYLRKIGYTDIYTDMKAGLLLFGYAFRDDKVKKIADILFSVVGQMEYLDIAPTEKQSEAVEVAFEELIEKLNLEIDENALRVIVDIAVKYLPPTHKE